MPTLIGKFTKDGTDYYFDYSTESGTALPAMKLDEYREHYSKLHGRMGLGKLPDRLERANAKGTSSRNRNSIDDMLKGNRAGEGHAELTTDQLIEQLMTKRAGATAAAP